MFKYSYVVIRDLFEGIEDYYPYWINKIVLTSFRDLGRCSVQELAQDLKEKGYPYWLKRPGELERNLKNRERFYSLDTWKGDLWIYGASDQSILKGLYNDGEERDYIQISEDYLLSEKLFKVGILEGLLNSRKFLSLKRLSKDIHLSYSWTLKLTGHLKKETVYQIIKTGLNYFQAKMISLESEEYVTLRYNKSGRCYDLLAPRGVMLKEESRKNLKFFNGTDLYTDIDNLKFIDKKNKVFFSKKVRTIT